MLTETIRVEWKRGYTRDKLREYAAEYLGWSDAEMEIFDRSTDHLVIRSMSEAERLLSALHEGMQEPGDSVDDMVMKVVMETVEDELYERGFDVMLDGENDVTVAGSHEYCMVCSPPPDAHYRIQHGDEVFCEDHDMEDFREQLRALDEMSPDHRPIGWEEVEDGN